MARFVIDPYVLVDLARDGRPTDGSHQLVAPTAIRSQALELLLDAVIRGELGERDALVLHERITGLKLRLLGDRVSRRAAWDLAREHGWANLREAEYLALTQLQADGLVAVEPTLRARARGIVPLVAPAVLYSTAPR